MALSRRFRTTRQTQGGSSPLGLLDRPTQAKPSERSYFSVLCVLNPTFEGLASRSFYMGINDLEATQQRRGSWKTVFLGSQTQ